MIDSRFKKNTVVEAAEANERAEFVAKEKVGVLLNKGGVAGLLPKEKTDFTGSSLNSVSFFSSGAGVSSFGAPLLLTFKILSGM